MESGDCGVFRLPVAARGGSQALAMGMKETAKGRSGGWFFGQGAATPTPSTPAPAGGKRACPITKIAPPGRAVARVFPNVSLALYPLKLYLAPTC